MAGIRCFVCRDEGKPGGCPACGKVLYPNGQPAVEVTPELLEEAKCPIPDTYMHRTWDSSILMNTFPELQKSRIFTQYVSQLDKIYNIFASGHLPNQSVMIIAPRRRAKLTFAYCCMKQALSYGYTVAPILDTSELKRLNILSADRYFSKELKELDYTIESIIDADVMFLTVDIDNFQSSYRTIDTFVNKRARRGKSTFILSRYTVEQISLTDYNDTFDSIIDKTRMQDKQKYLGLIIGE